MIKVFTTSTCAYCPQVKKYLSFKGIDYEEVSIENEEGLNAYREIAQRHGYNTVPLTTDGDTVVFGYQPGLLAKLA